MHPPVELSVALLVVVSVELPSDATGASQTYGGAAAGSLYHQSPVPYELYVMLAPVPSCGPTTQVG